jgi:hypothetical protein
VTPRVPVLVPVPVGAVVQAPTLAQVHTQERAAVLEWAAPAPALVLGALLEVTARVAVLEVEQAPVREVVPELVLGAPMMMLEVVLAWEIVPGCRSEREEGAALALALAPPLFQARAAGPGWAAVLQAPLMMAEALPRPLYFWNASTAAPWAAPA